MGPLPTSKSLVVVVDYYSQYFRVAVIQSTTTPKVSTALREIFVRLGYPSSLKTDNGPQFVSKGRSSRSSYMSRKLSIEDQHHYGCKPVVRSKDRRGPSKSESKMLKVAEVEGEQMEQRTAKVCYGIQVNT